MAFKKRSKSTDEKKTPTDKETTSTTSKPTTSTSTSTSSKILDLSKHVNDDIDLFGDLAYKRILEYTAIISGEKSTYTIDDINGVLARFTAGYAWVVIEAEKIKEL